MTPHCLAGTSILNSQVETVYGEHSVSQKINKGKKGKKKMTVEV